ncbi:SRPBCC family protein [Streptomyces bottropensis]|uniref:SRPBCC family protein n=1 Tax=Streptomyces bottropensis TaxID=42235 RepID=UPI0036B6109D
MSMEEMARELLLQAAVRSEKTVTTVDFEATVQEIVAAGGEQLIPISPPLHPLVAVPDLQRSGVVNLPRGGPPFVVGGTEIEVEVSAHSAFSGWSEFSKLPDFMEGVREVNQISETESHWVTEVAGAVREFDAKVERTSDEKVAWLGMDAFQGGLVTFRALGDNRAKVTLRLGSAVDSAGEVGEELKLIRKLADRDLQRFKTYVEGSEDSLDP